MKENKINNFFTYFKKPVCYTMSLQNQCQYWRQDTCTKFYLALSPQELNVSNINATSFFQWKLLKYNDLQYSFGKQAIVILTGRLKMLRLLQTFLKSGRKVNVGAGHRVSIPNKERRKSHWAIWKIIFLKVHTHRKQLKIIISSIQIKTRLCL